MGCTYCLAGSKNKQRRASSQALPRAMGNLFATPLPETAEFAAEFLRVQAAVAASACSPLQLEFVELKIVCAQVRARGGPGSWMGGSVVPPEERAPIGGSLVAFNLKVQLSQVTLHLFLKQHLLCSIGLASQDFTLASTPATREDGWGL
jgi:hypothetical protein